jgi:hypothetical protein
MVIDELGSLKEELNDIKSNPDRLMTCVEDLTRITRKGKALLEKSEMTKKSSEEVCQEFKRTLGVYQLISNRVHALISILEKQTNDLVRD